MHERVPDLTAALSFRSIPHALKSELRDVMSDPVPNVLAGLTVAVVALPLALAFGLIAFGPEYGPAAGLWSAIIAGFLAALLGGSAYAITGPTGVLAVFTGALVVQHGGFASPDAILFGFLVVALSGVMQIAFGALRMGRIVEYIPYPVVTGFMNGIAIIILWSGLQDALSPTDEGIPGGPWPMLGRVFTGGAPGVVYAALVLAALSFGITLLYPRLARMLPDGGVTSAFKKIPGSLLALILLTLTAAAFAVFSDVRHIRELPSGFPAFSLDFGLFARHPEWTRDLVVGALGLAAISSMDTLLTCVIGDGIVGQKTKSNRELVAQGVANAAAGALGASQACGAAVRTIVNIRNGGRTRLAGMTHALVLLTIVLLGAGLATLVPIAVLSGILLTTGFGMIEWRAIFEAHKAPRSDTLVMLVTTFVVVYEGLIEAVVVGVILAMVLFIKRMTELTDFVGEPAWTGRPREGMEGLEDDVLVYEIRGPLFFGPAARFTQSMERADLKDVKAIVFRLNSVTAVDETGLRAMEVIVERLHRNEQLVIFAHLPPDAHAKFGRFGLLDRVGRANVVDDFPSALTRAREVIGRDRQV